MSLTVEQQGQFFTDLFIALGQALHQRDWRIVEETVSRWRATAEVLAVPELASVLNEPLETGEWQDWDDVQAALFDTAA